jgi:hypothetical protein
MKNAFNETRFFRGGGGQISFPQNLGVTADSVGNRCDCIAEWISFSIIPLISLSISLYLVKVADR